uniref:F-box protein AT5G49610-like beta-propeller domain-containing protein n=1 Tax=Arundo donax TaxID=35708 RepID=A0A0A9A073_ARUDO
MCANLRMSNFTTEDGHTTAVYIQEVGDNAEFVFLEMYGCVFYLDVRSRALQKVYEVTEKDTYVCWIHPFMTIWPPFFPVVEE